MKILTLAGAAGATAALLASTPSFAASTIEAGSYYQYGIFSAVKINGNPAPSGNVGNPVCEGNAGNYVGGITVSIMSFPGFAKSGGHFDTPGGFNYGFALDADSQMGNTPAAYSLISTTGWAGQDVQEVFALGGPILSQTGYVTFILGENGTNSYGFSGTDTTQYTDVIGGGATFFLASTLVGISTSNSK